MSSSPRLREGVDLGPEAHGVSRADLESFLQSDGEREQTRRER